VVKSFVAVASDVGPGERVNWNHPGVSLQLMAGIVYVLSIYPKEQFTKPEQL
jgi:hypothetical protein